MRNTRLEIRLLSGAGGAEISGVDVAQDLDDETILWTTEEWRDHLVVTDGCRGLLDPTAQDRLLTVLTGQFGAAIGVRHD